MENWIVSTYPNPDYIQVESTGLESRQIAKVTIYSYAGIKPDTHRANAIANARRICQCVNSHDDLLAACKGLADMLTKPNATFKCPNESACELKSCRDCPIIEPYNKACNLVAKATKS